MKCAKQFICLHCPDADRQGECPNQEICRFVVLKTTVYIEISKRGKGKNPASANPYSRKEIAKVRHYLEQVKRFKRMSPEQEAAFNATKGIKYPSLSYEQCDQLIKMAKELRAKSRFATNA